MKMRKLTLPAILVFIIGIIMISCTGTKSQKDQDELRSGVEYYRQLQFSETPYDIEKGTHPITEAESKTVNSYKFTYDQGKLMSVEYQRNNVPLDYSSMGAAKITYTYNVNMQVKQWFNSKGEAIPNGGVWAAEYALNNEGRQGQYDVL